MSADSPLIAREEIGCRQSRDATISTLPSIQPKPNQRYSRKTVCCQKKTHFAAKLCFFTFFFHHPWLHRAHGSVLPALSRILHIPPGGRVEVQQENFTSIIEIEIRWIIFRPGSSVLPASTYLIKKRSSKTFFSFVSSASERKCKCLV